ncbi:MAG: glycerophosphodiester phosphodiesterase family protein [Bdellovibrionota bacterium]
MIRHLYIFAANIALVILIWGYTTSSHAAMNSFKTPNTFADESSPYTDIKIELGPRPFFLINNMDESPLKKALLSCSKKSMIKSSFSIAHRGAPLQFPEHSKESYEAAAKMGAGIIECDVTFTKDKELVCRHSQCDLHRTTNILDTKLAKKCTSPPDYNSSLPFKQVRCCTSDITLSEFKSLYAKMDSGDSDAKTLKEYLNATKTWRTDLYSTKAMLMTHKESIKLFKKMHVKMIPELKNPEINMPYDGFDQKKFAQKLINEYKEEGIDPKDVFPQSFNLEDIIYWSNNEPKYAIQAVLLEGLKKESDLEYATMRLSELKHKGVKIIAPPIWALVTIDKNNLIIPSQYAKKAKNLGLDIITWSLERSGPLNHGGGWFYKSISSAINKDGDVYTLLDILAKKIEIKGIFSDWPATVSYYANCMQYF